MKSALSVLVAALLVACVEENPFPQTPLLSYYIDSFQIPGLEFEPKSKVVYEYNDARRLERYRFYGYNPATDQFDEQRSFSFSYEDNKVKKIEGVLVNATTPYVTYTYVYNNDGSVASINEVNTDAGTSSQANFAYGPGHLVKVSYAYSNGSSFEYEYTFESGNILSDKTTRGSQLCSDGIYTYDQGENPFSSLGYVDYLLTNISGNNRLTETVNYVGCAFPSIVPESYTYEYDEQGFPLTSTTHYKSSGNSSPKSERTFFYK
jgi:hypothetical protein